MQLSKTEYSCRFNIMLKICKIKCVGMLIQLYFPPSTLLGTIWRNSGHSKSILQSDFYFSQNKPPRGSYTYAKGGSHLKTNTSVFDLLKLNHDLVTLYKGWHNKVCIKMLYLIGPDGLVNRGFIDFQKMVWMTTVHVLRFSIWCESFY